MRTFNEGTWDRAIRLVVGLALGYAALMTWPGTAAILSWTGFVSVTFFVVAFELFVTGLIGWSPFYALSDFSTKKKVNA